MLFFVFGLGGLVSFLFALFFFFKLSVSFDNGVISQDALWFR